MENKNARFDESVSDEVDRNNFDWKTILKHTERGMKMQDESVEALKAQARVVFGASSVVVPLFGTLQIFSQVSDSVKVLYGSTLCAYDFCRAKVNVR